MYVCSHHVQYQLPTEHTRVGYFLDALESQHLPLLESIEGDLINRASHSHGLYHDDNTSIYYKIEGATKGFFYADLIKPYQRRKNRRDTFEAMKIQYTRQDKR